MTVFEIVQAKLNNTAITDIDINMAIAEIEQIILNYCHIDFIPNGLKFTWANMAIDLVRYQFEINNPNNDGGMIDTADVSALKIGDTNITLGGGVSERSKTLQGHQPNLDQITMNYTAQLNKFRRMVW